MHSVHCLPLPAFTPMQHSANAYTLLSLLLCSSGKTTIAKRMGGLFHSLGVLGSPEVVVTSAADLQAPFVGQTAGKVQDVFRSAVGKVLFIDEAYRLAGGAGTFMKEAVDQIVDLLTQDEYKGKMIVILAGYPEQLEHLMRTVNPGLRSRFTGKLNFLAFTPEDCVKLLVILLRKQRMTLSDTVQLQLLPYFQQLCISAGFGSGRDVETISTSIVQEALLDDGAPEGDDDLQPLTLQQTAPHIERMSEERGGNGGVEPNSIPSDSPYAYASASASALPPPRQIIAQAEAPPPDAAADAAAPPPKQMLEAAPALQDRTARDANTTDAQWAELQASSLSSSARKSAWRRRLKSAAIRRSASVCWKSSSASSLRRKLYKRSWRGWDDAQRAMNGSRSEMAGDAEEAHTSSARINSPELEQKLEPCLGDRRSLSSLILSPYCFAKQFSLAN